METRRPRRRFRRRRQGDSAAKPQLPPAPAAEGQPEAEDAPPPAHEPLASVAPADGALPPRHEDLPGVARRDRTHRFSELGRRDPLTVPMWLPARRFLGGRRAAASSDVVSKYLQHGFVFVSCCAAAADEASGLLLWLHGKRGEAFAPDEPAEALGLKPGYCACVLRPLLALGVLRERNGLYTTDAELLDDIVRLPFEQIKTFLDGDLATAFGDEDACLGGPFVPAVRLLLESFYLAPVVVYLRLRLQGDSEVLRARGVPPRTPWLPAFERLGWTDDRGTFTAAGAYVFGAALTAGVPVSYHPLFRRLGSLLAGRGGGATRSGEAEAHLDRHLNVIASGAQSPAASSREHGVSSTGRAEVAGSSFERITKRRHRRFFDHLCESLREPLRTAKAVCDMGCGDGRLLATVWAFVREHRDLEAHPLTLIGVDFNAAALAETEVTLKNCGAPRLLLRGDVGDPQTVLDDLETRGFGRDDVLHVRSFLDHDRPYKGPVAPPPAWAAHEGVYARPDGGLITSADAFQSLTEHLDRWRCILGKPGLALLEAGQVPALEAGKRLDRCPALAFDCCQGLSHQLLVPIDQWLRAAAAAGLWPITSRTFPENPPRVLLARLAPKPYRARPGGPGDLNAVLALEAAAWEPAMRTRRQVVQERLAGSCSSIVATVDGRVRGAVFFRRLDDAGLDAVTSGTWAKRDRAKPCPAGRHVLLLDLFADRRACPGGALGRDLRDLALALAKATPGVDRVTGVTRARNYRSQDEAYAAYCLGPAGARDAGLALHAGAGARLLRVVENWRPADAQNAGHGVLMAYELIDTC